MLNSDFFNSDNEIHNTNFRASDLPSLIYKALNFENFCFRNYKPILSKLKEEGLINNNEFIEKKETQNFNYESCISYPHYYKPNPPFDYDIPEPTQSPKGYFKVWFNTDSNYKLIKDELIKKYQTKIKNIYDNISPNVIYISIDELEFFLNEYSKCKDIYVSSISSETNINWNNKLLTNYKSIWNWKSFEYNSKIKMNFEIIEANYDKLDWFYISGNQDLIWDEISLDKWKSYLIFSDSEWSSVNEIGLSYKASKYTNSISKSSKVKWNYRILDKLKDYFDWSELSENESINWDAKLLRKFKDKVDFKKLSLNKNVKWSEILIEEFREELDWNNLSGNPSLPWSINFLLQYDSLFSWKPKYNWYKDEQCVREPSISGNEGVIWSEILIDKFKDKLDFWILARVGNIDPIITLKYKEKFDRKEQVGFIHHKSSDNRETEHIFVNGWQNLTKNENFYLDRNLILFYNSNKISISFSTGNLASSNSYNYGQGMQTRNISLLYILKEKSTNLTRNDLIENEFGWTKILINEDFINPSIWSKLVKPFIINYSLDLFLKNLKNNILNE